MADLSSKCGKPLVSDLQKYLRDRGVCFGTSKKHELCRLAKEVGLQTDPDGYIEDREEVIGSKLVDGSVTLTNPGLIDGSDNLSILPAFSVFDICSYLLSKNVPLTSIRDYRRSEAFSLMQDGYVTRVETVQIPNVQGYFALKAAVKPRTRDKDPVSGKAFYYTWAIITDVGTDNRSRIFSAFCSCKGGMDGCCRHILASLYEVINFVEDKQVSVTSGACQWVRRSNIDDNAMLITDVETCQNQATIGQDAQPKELRPSEENYKPIPSTVQLPQVSTFFEGLKELHPSSCFLDVWEPRQTPSAPAPPPLRTDSPSVRLATFLRDHHCECADCDCSTKFLDSLLYSSCERQQIEEDTTGQHQNENWFTMRSGLITASVIKKVLSSTNYANTAERLVSPSSLDNGNLPAAVKFGRTQEHRALTLFTKLHRYKHRKCSVRFPGLVVSETDSFLAGSPDAVVDCSHCGKFVVEIKCLYSKQNMHPRLAMKLSDFCVLDNDKYRVKRDHAYFCQLQCQMAVTGLKSGVLVVYTRKGVEVVPIDFDEEWWEASRMKLKQFYPTFFHTWKAHVLSRTPVSVAMDVVSNTIVSSHVILDTTSTGTETVESEETDTTSTETETVESEETTRSDTTSTGTKMVSSDTVDAVPMDVMSDRIVSSSTTISDRVNVMDNSAFCNPVNVIDMTISASIASHQKHIDHVQSSMQQFATFLQSQNFRLRGETPSDGNCFFHAISNQLTRTGQGNSSAGSIRKLVCDYLDNMSHAEQVVVGLFIVGKSFDQYVTDLRKNGTSADALAVEGTSRVLGLSITVVTQPRSIVIHAPASAGTMLYVGYIADLEHYVSVEPHLFGVTQ
ncbi:uncharacterized protein [Littorina saxatilis]|uniref:uncharacterized protein n=1 Tax=Littorina saxatilis TaxID=31220 RepID=UPI0038B5B88E